MPIARGHESGGFTRSRRELDEAFANDQRAGHANAIECGSIHCSRRCGLMIAMRDCSQIASASLIRSGVSREESRIARPAPRMLSSPSPNICATAARHARRPRTPP